MKYREIKNIPIIKRVTEKDTEESKCRMTFHGAFDEET